MRPAEEMFAARSAWPLADLRAIVEEALALLVDRFNRYDDKGGDQVRYEVLQREFTALARMLGEHAACCENVTINVHWW